MPGVSIIIPAFNRFELLEQTLASVAAQTYADYEVILVDDGSTPELASVLELKDPRVHLLRVPHGGQGAARNTGLELARGKYIAFLDSDDLWEPTWLEELTRALADRPAAGWCYCDYVMIEPDGRTSAPYLEPRFKSGGDMLAQLLELDFLCVGQVLLDRERCGHFRFDDSLPPVEDWDYWLQLAQARESVYLDRPLVRIRSNPHGLARNPGVVYSSNLRVLDKFEKAYPAEARAHRAAIRRQREKFQRALLDYHREKREPLAVLKHLAQLASARARPESR